MIPIHILTNIFYLSIGVIIGTPMLDT